MACRSASGPIFPRIRAPIPGKVESSLPCCLPGPGSGCDGPILSSRSGSDRKSHIFRHRLYVIVRTIVGTAVFAHRAEPADQIEVREPAFDVATFEATAKDLDRLACLRSEPLQGGRSQELRCRVRFAELFQEMAIPFRRVSLSRCVRTSATRKRVIESLSRRDPSRSGQCRCGGAGSLGDIG